MTTRNEQTRRSFLAAIGVGAAALAVPAGAAEPARFAAGTWRQSIGSWPAAVEAMKAQTDAIVAQFRPAYLAEVERFAEELRQLFESANLRPALGDPDENKHQKALDRLEQLGATRFGVNRCADDDDVDEGQETLGRMICKVSPSAPEWDVDGDEDGAWAHPCLAAEACIGSDVLAVVKARGWGVRS